MVTRAPICFTIPSQAWSEMFAWNGPKCTQGNVYLAGEILSQLLPIKYLASKAGICVLALIFGLRMPFCWLNWR